MGRLARAVQMLPALVGVACGPLAGTPMSESEGSVTADATSTSSVTSTSTTSEASTTSVDVDTGTTAATIDAGMPPRIVQIAAGWSHTCAVVDDGTVRCWGSGAFRLGYGGTASVGIDAPIWEAGAVTIGEPVTSIASSNLGTCVVAESGAVYCWGRGDSGMLGHGNDAPIGDNETPADVGPVPLGALARQVVQGDSHTCALLTDDSVRCWGSNASGRLGLGVRFDVIDAIGDDEPASAAPPVDVGGPVAKLSANEEWTCALRTDGALLCWGGNNGQYLGYGDADGDGSPVIHVGDDETPAEAGPLDMGGVVIDVSCGNRHICAVREGGDVLCWGKVGEVLGYPGVDEVLGDLETPAQIGPIDLGEPAVAVAAGFDFSCATSVAGTVRCWGANDGRLGYGHTEPVGDDETPAAAGTVDLGDSVLQVSSWAYHACGVRADGAAICWGINGLGALGYGAAVTVVGDDETPAAVGPVPIFER